MLTYRQALVIAILTGSLAFVTLRVHPQAPKATMTIQADHPTAAVSPTLYGLMTEEINHSWDGGVDAELVRNRTVIQGPSALDHWSSIAVGASTAQISLDSTSGPGSAVLSSIKLNVTSASAAAPAGFQNDGYWGIPVRPRTTYSGSFYARSDSAQLPMRVRIVNDHTGAIAASASVILQSGNWREYHFTFSTGDVKTSGDNHLQFIVSRPAVVWLNVISLYPPTYHNRPHGNRIDLMEKLAAMRPKFMRLPGGNYLEGRHTSERFDWKATIGPWIDRPTHPSPWRYQSSDNMGLLELLDWCQDLQIEPVLAVYAGYSLRQEVVWPGATLDPYVQDALDEIEYVTGNTSTKWGAERARDGHPAPFPLRYVEIGNEDARDRSGSYEGRYIQFYKAIKKRYPNIQLIATAPLKSMKPDLLDRHFYMKPEQAFAAAHKFDNADRSGPRILVGEWATRTGTPTPDLRAALGDAAWMTGLERNSDLVVMASYAPLLVNVNPGAMQWVPDLIGYDALSSYGSPSYWAQKMFASYLGSEVVDTTSSGIGPLLFTSVTRDNTTKKLFLKVVNAAPTAESVRFSVKGAGGTARNATLITLSGDSPDATNTLSDPSHLVPLTRKIKIANSTFEETFAPYSINVLDLSYQVLPHAPKHHGNSAAALR